MNPASPKLKKIGKDASTKGVFLSLNRTKANMPIGTKNRKSAIINKLNGLGDPVK